MPSTNLKHSLYDPVFVSEAFQKTIETFGTLDIVVNNAGIFNESEWEKEVDINLVGHICLYCTYIYRAIYGTNMR
jgi:NAD(P)-dependent dehydrogenase (short-subunit alcohol dehydrogenase family)